MCEFCESEGIALYQQTVSTKLMIDNSGWHTALFVESDPWELKVHHVPVRSRFTINFCPNCGRDLRKNGRITMERAVMISIRPKWCSMIASGKKTAEIRKTAPKMLTPFKVYIYCTKGKDRLLDILRDRDENFGEIYHGKAVFIKMPEDTFCFGNGGKVIGEFVCDALSEITLDRAGIPTLHYSGNAKDWRACVTAEECRKYMAGRKRVLAWHISDLEIYQRPKQLSDFGIDRPPQSWRYIEGT